MTSHAPSPHGSPTASTRVRVKWDNVMIVLIGTVVAAFAVVGILMYSSGTEAPTKAAKDTANTATTEQVLPATEVEDPATGELSLDDAIGVVEEVRALMTEGRWDEASDRLELIPAELRDASGATVVLEELETSRATHDRIRSELQAAVEARNWKVAQTLLKQLAALAPLDADLTATQELVDTALAPKVQAPATPAATKKDSTSGGGATTPTTSPATKPATKPASTTKPSSGSSKPAGSNTKPSGGGAKPSTSGTRPPVTGGGASSGGSSTGTGAPTGGSSDVANVAAGIGAGSTLGDLGINLTPEQEAELEAALNQAIAGL